MGWQLPSYLVRSSNAVVTRFLEGLKLSKLVLCLGF